MKYSKIAISFEWFKENLVLNELMLQFSVNVEFRLTFDKACGPPQIMRRTSHRREFRRLFLK